jgi:2-hydroxy-3-oxopropionate reductase
MVIEGLISRPRIEESAVPPSVAFIGLGIMGRPMAANLVEAGFEVVGFSRTSDSRDAGRAAGVRVAESLDDAITGAEVVITMLPDSPDVRQVLLAEDGVLARLSAGATVIDMSTIAPVVSRRVHQQAAERGIGALDAPVSGGEAAAIEGTLSIMVGGEPDVFHSHRKLLEAMGQTVVHVGEAGAGQVVKSANQLMVAAHLQALAEALFVVRAHGVDPASAMSVISKGLAGSTVIDRKFPAMLNEQFSPGFRIALQDKDLRIVTDAARRSGHVLPLTALVGELAKSLVARGDGALDHSGLYKLLNDLNGNGRP